MCNKVEYDLKDSRKFAAQLEDFFYSKGMLIFINGGNFKYYYWGGGFHMLPQPYKILRGLSFNNLLQVWLIVNQRYQVPPFIYTNQDDEVSHLARGRKSARGHEIFNEVS